MVRLPTYVVKDDRILPPPQRWDYAAGPGLEVLTSADLAQSEALATDFLRFHRAMAAVWPLERMHAAVPVMLILCGDERRAAPFIPPGTPSGVDTFLSISVQDRELASIVIDLDPDLLAAGESGDTALVLRREFIHLVLARLGRLAPWIRQGLWVAFTSMRCADAELGFPAADGGPQLKQRQAGDPEALAAAEKMGAFLPLAAVISAPASAADTPNGAWSQECYQFVHLCLLGEPGTYRLPFLEYVLASESSTADEALFRRYFHAGYAEFTRRLWHYTGFASDRVYRILGPDKKPEALPALRFHRATDGQAGRIVGETLRMQGKAEAAHWALIAPYQRGSRDPDLLAALGLAELAQGHEARARQFLEAATAAGTTRARAWAELARLRLQQALARPGESGGRMTAAQYQSVMIPLIHAHRLLPPLPEEYQIYRQASAHAPIPRNAAPLPPSK